MDQFGAASSPRDQFYVSARKDAPACAAPAEIAAVQDQIEAQQQSQSMPENISALAAVADGLSRCGEGLGAIESLPCENPKLSAVTIASMNERDFALRLERCIARSNGAWLIEARAINADDNG